MMKKSSSRIAFSLIFFFFFLFVCHGIVEMRGAMAQNTTRSAIPVSVGVVVDMDERVGRMGLSCISMALSDFYSSHSYYNNRLVLHPRDSKKDVVAAAAAALDLIKNVEVQAIIGPLTSMQAEFMINLGDKARIPIISYSATSPSLSSIRSPYFVRATQNDSSQVKAIVSVIKAFGWREVVPVYVDNDFGEGIIPFLTDRLQNINVRVLYRSIISPSATGDQILTELYKLMTMQTRVFIVHMLPSLASQLFTKAKEIGMMGEGYIWIITSSITSDLSSISAPVIISSMQGVVGVKPYIPRTIELESFTNRWKRKFQQENPTVLNPQLNHFGLWAYDAAIALAMAVEKIGVADLGFQKAIVSTNSTDLESFGVSRSGPQLAQALHNTSFKGLSGDFVFVNGQLELSTYQIVNIIGNVGRVIGYWIPDKGVVRELNTTNINTNSTPKRDNLRTIIWPGDPTSLPKGWQIPTDGKKLQIGVPMKAGFREFVNVTKDPNTNRTTVTGYCIDVFEAVIARLPYSLPHEYIPFATPNGRSAGTYDDLVYQVFLGNFDAVVGDVTIIANRSQYVDFTLPYTESGVSFIVPIEDNNKKNPWVFLKPLTWELWITSFCSFIFIGFVIWVLEHRTNEDFRGPPPHQAGMIFWFSFSTMVFAHKEKVVSNLARFVVIIWIFVVLILTQSYTASLTSMLTVQQLQPTVRDIEELVKKSEYVGYQNGSFVKELLKQKSFDESKLRAYNSVEEWDDLFSKGSNNGGIAAALEEIPFIKLLLAGKCSKYTMISPTYKTDGFGFVFPISSPLVPDISRAVLNMTQGDGMEKIETDWLIGKQISCSNSSLSIASNSLGLQSFWGLFLIAGVASLSALVIFLGMFIHEHIQVLRELDPEASMWKKFLELCKKFDMKDLRSHTFRTTEMVGRSGPITGIE